MTGVFQQLKGLVRSWQVLPGKFGTPKVSGDPTAASQELVYRTLNREHPIEALEALLSAMDYRQSPLNIATVAIALDANVFLRISSHKKSSDIIDYLSSRHKAPLILPGQAVQEFWNNHLNVVATVAKGLRSDFEKLNAKVEGLDEDFGSFSDDFRKILDRFEQEHGSVYDAATVRKTITLMQALKQRALVPFVHREKFQKIAEHRNQTKTPPGFEDQRDGDFFVWADFLYGLCLAKSSGDIYSGSVFVTNEKKPDWIRDGVPHPILTAEAQAVSLVPFSIWHLDQLGKEIERVT